MKLRAMSKRGKKQSQRRDARDAGALGRGPSLWHEKWKKGCHGPRRDTLADPVQSALSNPL